MNWIIVFAVPMTLASFANGQVRGNNRELREAWERKLKMKTMKMMIKKTMKMPDIVVYTPGAADPSQIVPLPTSPGPLPLGTRIVADDFALDAPDGEPVFAVEGVCTAVNEPTMEELGMGIFPKIFCDFTFDDGYENIIAITETLIFNNDPNTDGVGIVTGGTGKYEGVSGTVVTKDPANFDGLVAEKNFYLIYPH